MSHEPQPVTLLLQAVSRGEPGAETQLLEAIYQELKRLAASKMRTQRSDHTLQPTALVHETYLRLLGDRQGSWKDRGHFFAAAAAAMRSVLVDHARRRGALKRGGDQPRVVFDDSIDGAADLSGEVVAVNDALEELEKSEPRKGRIVELYYFAGLSIDEIARLLELSRRTVDRDLRFARAWLHDHMHGP